LEVRVLPAPPRSLTQTEISRLVANSPELAGIRARILSLQAIGKFMNRLLIVGILVISTVPLFAQAQQPDAAKLKADAQKVVSIISGDTADRPTLVNQEKE
jgi:hypothetical protein